MFLLRSKAHPTGLDTFEDRSEAERAALDLVSLAGGAPDGLELVEVKPGLGLRAGTPERTFIRTKVVPRLREGAELLAKAGELVTSRALLGVANGLLAATGEVDPASLSGVGASVFDALEQGRDTTRTPVEPEPVEPGPRG